MATRQGMKSKLMQVVSIALMAYGATLLLLSLGFLIYSKTAEAELAALNQVAPDP